MHVYMGSLVCLHASEGQRSTLGTPLFHSLPCFFETGSCSEPRTYCFGQSGWLASSQDLPVTPPPPTGPSPGLTDIFCHAAGFYTEAGDSNSDLSACTVSTGPPSEQRTIVGSEYVGPCFTRPSHSEGEPESGLTSEQRPFCCAVVCFLPFFLSCPLVAPLHSSLESLLLSSLVYFVCLLLKNALSPRL